MDLFKYLPTGTDASDLSEGQLIKTPLSIMWTERYRDAGEFELVDKLSSGLRETLPLGTLISHTHTLEVMIVENHEIDDNKSEDPIIKITGRSLESSLENRIIGSNIIRAGSLYFPYGLNPNTTWTQAMLLINDHINSTQYPDDVFGNISAVTDVVDIISYQEARVMRPDNIYKAILDLLVIDDLGIKVNRKNLWTAMNQTRTNFIIHNGKDKSSSVIFSWQSGDLDIADYLWTDKPSKTTAMVMGRYVNVAVDDNSGATKFGRKMVLVPADDIDGNLSAPPSGAALNNIVAQMQTRGYQALQKQSRLTITRTDISDISKYHYRQDYNMGDIITLDGNFGQIAKMRVIEYVEIQDENGMTGHPSFSVPYSKIYSGPISPGAT